MILNILIGDDHSMIRTGVKLLLQTLLGYRSEQIHEAKNCNELMTKLRNGKYTHLILDIILPDGNTLEIIPAIKQLYPDLQILILSMQPQEVYSLAMNHYAINYYVSKGSAENEILTSFKKFFDNKPLESNVRARAHSQTNNPFIELTPRELEVLHYLLRGENTKDISSVLNLKMNTVSTFKNRIFGKTNTSNIRELLEKASLYNMRF